MLQYSVSKLATAAGLLLLWILQSLPPNTLSAHAGDKTHDKYFGAGSITAAKAIGLIFGLLGLAVTCDDMLGRQSMRQPWSLADVIYVAMALAGAVLRLWAMKVLAKHFTFEVGIVKDHKLVQSGPYQRIRHPGYTGAIVCAVGTLGFLCLRPPGMVWFTVFAVPMTLFMAARITNEEHTLHQHFGKQWEQHCKRTWRLFPPLL
ncbi:hypothetical protein CVIRNUC_002077 [Coccomyxa viridis]|uniref:Protein-S-isoprenylcysteine O-methyltransferase n=1 Tax=Coccomyxa viridis TaxID=1274662 RepID=A0AAV1HUX9_9CHLO|nr:hypothetical protein CVIRNUC_002077 [Coccomyxa viridis]